MFHIVDVVVAAASFFAVGNESVPKIIIISDITRVLQSP